MSGSAPVEGRATAAPDPQVADAPPEQPAARLARLPATAWSALLAFVVTAVAVVWPNRALFDVALPEVGDAAANSLLVNQAKDLDLLVGHYSRVGFNHPGPAVLYVQAAGEGLLHDLLGLVPAPYNGQAIAVMLLSAAVVAAVVAVVHRWSGSLAVAAAALSTCLVWFAFHEFSLGSPWIPVLVVAPFLLLLVSAASVASGHPEHLWLLALVSGLLVHAHVAFALPVGVLVPAALAGWAWTERSGPLALLRRHRRRVAVAAAVAGAFVAPIVLNTLLNWPGELPKYVGYSGDQAGSRPSLPEAIAFTLQFWAQDDVLDRVVPVVLTAAAVVAVVLAPTALRRPLAALTAAALTAEGLFVVYALVGIDDLSQVYVGYFGWAVPVALVLVVVTSVAARARSSGAQAAVAAASAAALVAGLVLADAPFRLRPEFAADLPPALAAVDDALRPLDGPVVVDMTDTGPAFTGGTGLLLHLERSGVDACVSDDAFTVQVGARRICTEDELERGRRVEVRDPGTAPRPTVRHGLSDFTVR